MGFFEAQTTYQTLEEKSSLFDLNEFDYNRDFTDPTAKLTGTFQAPKAAAAKPDPSVAPPNNYITSQQLTDKAMTNLFQQRLQSLYPDTVVFDNWGTSSSSGLSKVINAFKSMNQIGQAVEDLFLNEMGGKSLVALKNYATPYLLGAAGMLLVGRIPVLGPMLMGALGSSEMMSMGIGSVLGGGR